MRADSENQRFSQFAVVTGKGVQGCAQNPAGHGKARIIAATAASQKEFLAELTRSQEIEWPRVEVFHLDEYIELPVTHPGSFRKMLVDQLIRKNRNRKPSLARW